MFDLRYHVASLAAVFIALIVGILIGVGLSGRGFVSDSERQLLNARITDLQQRAASAESHVTTLSVGQKAASAFIERTYPAVVGGRLVGKRIAFAYNLAPRVIRGLESRGMILGVNDASGFSLLETSGVASGVRVG